MNDQEQEFVYDAPQFVDFNQSLPEDENADAYFEKVHEHLDNVPVNNHVHVAEREMDEEFFTPMKFTSEMTNAERCLQSQLRRSMSVGNIPEELTQVRLNNNNTDAPSEAVENGKIHEDNKTKGTRSRSRPRTSSLTRYKSSSKLNLCKLAEPKNNNMQRYVSMAEAISRFHSATPPRFRHNNNQNFVPLNNATATTTIPHSPYLLSKTRSRPTTVLNNQQREELEIQEAQKHKIKVHPVNKKILQGPTKLAPVEKKPATVPEPFHLTEVPPKKIDTPQNNELFEFHAKPVPKSLSNPFKPVIKQSITNTHTVPNFVKRLTKNNVRPEVNGTGAVKKCSEKLGALKITEIKPFSFEKRDQQILKKKEELVHKVLEEEKKAREFHAKPVPKNIFKSPIRNYTFQKNASSNSVPKNIFKSPQKNFMQSYKQRKGSLSSLQSNESDETLNTFQFKARPAKVLQMKPFEPKKAERTLVEITDFQLNTDKRAKEREQFEQELKKRDEKNLKLKERAEELRKLHELEEIARLRKEAEHKAQPIKHYKELPTVSVKKVTIPMSPKFATDERLKNKENTLVLGD